jgi:pantothenate synthetase
MDAVKGEIESEPLARLEYAKLCDPATLAELKEIQNRALVALAVRIGKTRLIDNMLVTAGEA